MYIKSKYEFTFWNLSLIVITLKVLLNDKSLTLQWLHCQCIPDLIFLSHILITQIIFLDTSIVAYATSIMLPKSCKSINLSP